MGYSGEGAPVQTQASVCCPQATTGWELGSGYSDSCPLFNTCHLQNSGVPQTCGGGGRSAVEQADQHKIYALISLQKAHNLKSVLVWKNQSEAVAPTRPHEI